MKPVFVNEATVASVITLLESSEFSQENGRSTLSFGVPYNYTESRSCNEVPPIPHALQPMIYQVNTLQNELYYQQYPNLKDQQHSHPPSEINSCLVNQ